jgi:hypothetical protein
LEHCPEYFWDCPASSTGKYHPKSHSKKHGLWLHTKKSFTVYEDLSDSWLEQGLVSQYEVNCGRAAILLHDLLKYGEPGDSEDWQRPTHTVSNHDRLASNLLKREMGLPDEAVACVDSHNGPWCRGKSPEDALEMLHHVADMVASRRRIDGIAVYKPCKELRNQFTDLRECDLE